MRRLNFVLLLLAASVHAETIFISDEAAKCVQATDGVSLKPLGCIEVGQPPRGRFTNAHGK